MDVHAPRIRFEEKSRDPFYQKVGSEVDAYLASHGGRLAPPVIWLKFAGLLLIGASCYGLALVDLLPLWLRLASYTAFGVTCLFLVINVSHDAAHDALSRNRKVNRVVHALVFNLMGINGHMWRTRHLRSHHVYPNVVGCDVDIDANYLLRLSPHHPHRRYQRFQHLYAPFVYLLVTLHSILVQDFQNLFRKRIANIRQDRVRIRQIGRVFAGKAYHFAIALVIPLLFSGLPGWQVLIGYLIMTAVSSLVFVFLLVGTHFAMECLFSEVGRDGKLPNSWSIHCLATALDWSPQNRVVNFLCGGINAHAAHHLFPGVSHAHCVEISRIIKRNSRRYGVRYNESTFIGMVRSHFRFLREMAREPRAGNAVVLTRLPGPAARSS